MLAGCKKSPEQRIWHTIWFMQLNDGSGQIVGDLCFKGLNDNGSVEIGYGMKEDYEGRVRTNWGDGGGRAKICMGEMLNTGL